MSSLRAIVICKNITEIVWYRLKSIFLLLYLTWGVVLCDYGPAKHANVVASLIWVITTLGTITTNRIESIIKLQQFFFSFLCTQDITLNFYMMVNIFADK